MTRQIDGARECGYALPKGYALKPLDEKGLWWSWAKGEEIGPERFSPGPAVFDAWMHATTRSTPEQASNAEHTRLADAAGLLLDAIDHHWVGDLPTALEAIAVCINEYGTPWGKSLRYEILDALEEAKAR